MSVVNAPLLAVVEPIVPGEFQVDPSKVLALMVPLPVKLSVPPEPTTIVANVLVPEPIPENGTLPTVTPDGDAHSGAPVVPLEVRMYPLVPGVREVREVDPFAYITP